MHIGRTLEHIRHSVQGIGIRSCKTNGMRARANPHAKQHEAKNVTELDDCIKYLVDERGFNKADAKYYCKALGNRWQELVNAEESLCP